MAVNPGKPRILYVGDGSFGGTCTERMNALIEQGHLVHPFDICPYQNGGNRIQRSIAHRLLIGPAITAMNRDLLAFAERNEHDWVWVDRGIWVKPDTLRRLSRNGKIRLIHYTPDPQIVFHRTRFFMASLPVYDVIITNKRYELDLYRQHGARDVLFSHTAFSRAMFRRPVISNEDRARFQADVVFVGHCEPHYISKVWVATRVVQDVAVWGMWGRAARFRPWVRRIWRGRGIFGADYVKGLACAKIALGLLTKLAPDTATTRSMEIPASGTFMLAERTGEHLELFEEGKDAEFFSSDAEMQDKLEYYLKHDEERERIAAAGHARVMNSGYSYQDRVREAVDYIVSRPGAGSWSPGPPRAGESAVVGPAAETGRGNG